MMSCAYINHLIDKKETNLKNIIQDYIAFIGKNLLEEEVVSIGFLMFSEGKIEYALFSMPPVLYQKENEVLKIRSNNPPLASWTKEINISEIETDDIKKMIFYSDGLNENRLKNSDEAYGKKLIEDFKNSLTMEEFEEKRVSSIDTQEDDVTYLFLKKIK